MIENRHLHYYLTVVREGNFSKAAEALGLTQPTLSKQIIDLEQHLGKKLLIRGKRKVELTSDGEFLRSRAEEILSLMQNTESSIMTKPESIEGEIFIGCAESAAMYDITRVMKEFQQEHPAVRFNIFSADGMSVIEKIDKGLIDIGLVLGYEVPNDRYEVHKLDYHDRFGLLMRSDSPLASKENISMSDIVNEPIIVSRQSGAEISSLRKQMFLKNIRGSYNLIFNATYMVEQGIGYAMALDRLVSTEGSRGLVFKPFHPEITIQAALVTKRHREYSLAVKLFLDRLKVCK